MTVKSTLALTNSEQIARIKTNLRVGAGFVLAGVGTRQWLVLAAESLDGGRLAGMQDFGAVSMIITRAAGADAYRFGHRKPIMPPLPCQILPIFIGCKPWPIRPVI